MTSLLKVDHLAKYFGGLKALKDITVEAAVGQIVGIIGPNGAGKTTLFNCLTGLYYPTDGQIVIDDTAIVPESSVHTVRRVQNLAHLFLLVSMMWVPLFASFFMQRTYFKVESILLTLFLFCIRFFAYRGLRQFQLWAWGIVLVFAVGDIYLGVWWIGHPSALGTLTATSLPFSYVAWPWGILTVPFSLYLLWFLLLRRVRELYGFRQGPDAICRFGVSRTFQNIRLFLKLSVLDNIKIGSHVRIKSGLLSSLFRTASQKAEEAAIEKDAIEILKFIGLQHRILDLAGALAYGEQRRLEIGRAMSSRPKIMLLDEPAAGMNPQESTQLIRLIKAIRDRGMTILIIEHDMKVMMNLADHIYVMDHGELIAQGSPEEIRTDQKVIEAYLGGGKRHVTA